MKIFGGILSHSGPPYCCRVQLINNKLHDNEGAGIANYSPPLVNFVVMNNNEEWSNKDLPTVQSMILPSFFSGKSRRDVYKEVAVRRGGSEADGERKYQKGLKRVQERIDNERDYDENKKDLIPLR